jgi:hypothetical protein
MNDKKYSTGHIGEQYITNEGCICKIIEGGSRLGYCTIKIYGGKKNYIGEFRYAHVKNGAITNPNLIKKYLRNHIGEKYILDNGDTVDIIDTGSKAAFCTAKITCKTDGMFCIKEVQYFNLSNPNYEFELKNPLRRTFCNVGYMGCGEYPNRNKKVHLKAYSSWVGMLARCYSKNSLKTNPTYKNTFVCDEWHNFQNFAEWYIKNYREFKDSTAALDKDLLGDSTLYSPKTCCIIPKELNSFIIRIKNRGRVKHIGITLRKDGGKYDVTIYSSKEGKNIRLGRYSDLKKAREIYNVAREDKCKQMKQKCIDKWGITDKNILNNIE